jgi:alkylhydroperoxidase family enzyme
MYPDADVRKALLADPTTAPIPPLHRETFRFAERFVCNSSSSTPQDLERLREAGLSDREIVRWATIGSTQSWFMMSADGGGVSLDGDAMTGTDVGRTRASYEATPGGLLGATAGTALSGDASNEREIAWVATDDSDSNYQETARWAERRYGFVPNLLRAVSLQPAFYPRHRLALELLERPQSQSLSSRQHAMVRMLASHLSRGRYSEGTARALMSRLPDGDEVTHRLTHDLLDLDWTPLDRAVIALTTKFARNAYKVTEKDAIGLREVGLDDEAYVDILNTVSIQISLDRLANVLGVQPDSRPLLGRT